DVATNVATSVSTSVNLGLDGIIPSDNDFADVDIYGGGSVDQLFINRDGVISYDPGDDVSFEDILNGSLNGSGNNAFVFNQVNDLVDNDTLSDPQVHNNGNFQQQGSASGGFAKTGDGINAGGGGGDGGGDANADGGSGGRGSAYGSDAFGG